jgi:hypothetical protein
MRWGGMNGRQRICAYRVLTGKPEGKRPLGRPTCKWYIKIYFTETGWDGMDLARDKDKWRALVMCNERSGSIKFWESLHKLRNN